MYFVQLYIKIELNWHNQKKINSIIQLDDIKLEEYNAYELIWFVC